MSDAAPTPNRRNILLFLGVTRSRCQGRVQSVAGPGKVIPFRPRVTKTVSRQTAAPAAKREKG